LLYVASVPSTAPDELRTWIFRVSCAVVLVLAVSMCSQKLRLSLAHPDGIVAVCASVSVWARP